MPVSTDTWRTRCPRKSDRVHLVTDDHRRPALDGPGSRPPLFLDAFGAELWERLDGESDLDSIISGLSRSFGFPPSEATDHVRIWVDALFDHGLVEGPDGQPLATEDGEFGTTWDFILMAHAMATDPTGRPTSLDLLHAVTACDPTHQSAWERIITALTDELGAEQSVWGVKLHEGRISYELYFCTRLPYPNEVLQPILDAAATGFARVGTWTAPRGLPPYSGMVSFEFAIDPDGGIHGPDDLDVYERSDPASDVWVNYRLANDGRYLRNTYQAHEIPGDESGLAEWFAMSRFATDEHPSGGASYWLDHIRGLEACVGTWCARKPTCDGIYLRRTHPVDLARFLTDHGYPGQLRSFVNENVDRLDHLRFEQGFDFTVDDDEVTVLKTAFYGYF